MRKSDKVKASLAPSNKDWHCCSLYKGAGLGSVHFWVKVLPLTKIILYFVHNLTGFLGKYLWRYCLLLQFAAIFTGQCQRHSLITLVPYILLWKKKTCKFLNCIYLYFSDIPVKGFIFCHRLNPSNLLT